MSEKWKFYRFRDRLKLLAMVFVCLSFQCSNFCWSLNDEGLALLKFKERIVSDPLNALSDWRESFGELDSCLWYGVECSDGKVIILNLKDLCLGGTLAPELGQLVHIKSIVLRNNSFTGLIPEEISQLKELEILDLGYNDFTGPVPSKLGNNLSLTILLLDNNRLLGTLSPKLHELTTVSEFLIDEDQLSGAAKKTSCKQRPNSWHEEEEDSGNRRILQGIPRRGEAHVAPPSPSVIPLDNTSVSDPPPVNSSSGAAAAPSPTETTVQSLNPPPPSEPAPPVSTTSLKKSGNSGKSRTPLVAGIIAGVAVIVLAAVAFVCVKTKVTNVNPWATGLSGQLKKALVTGVPKLRRSELETACEDFSNVIGSSSIGMLYKGTLSSGVEIAVACVAATSAKEWSETLELQFLKKIDTLSKVNHKNFVNLIGYCQEAEPFTRMMVFEYAPSGTLFEHLHIQEAEHLDWGMRLRVAMGVAYCLDYMHQLEIPEAHNNLSSSAIRLTEDYAAKIAEFTFWNEIAAVAPRDSSMGSKRFQKNNQTSSPECNVYNFGVILFEMVTGRVPYSVDNGSLENWASDYLIGDRPLKEMVDPTLSSYQEDQLEEIGKVIKACVHPDPRRRPEMREVCIGLREVTGITPDGAAPRISPMWWAELELMSDTM